MKKITVFIYGGLGNQIFQYAISRRIADQFGLKLVLNITPFERDFFFRREFQLTKFDIRYDEIEAGNNLRFQLMRFIQHVPFFNPFFRFILPNYIVEAKNDYKINNLSSISLKFDQYYIFGYWHDERYFDQIALNLKSSFSVISSISSINTSIIRGLNKEQSVAVHMRFSHMVKTGTNFTDNAMYQLGGKYYEKAFQYFLQYSSSLKFYIFSDKPGMAKEYFNSTTYNVIVLEDNRGPDYEDLFIMSKFKYHIIANSSFSWWGAWLAENFGDNIVIAPSTTLFTPIIPSRWLTFGESH